MYRFSDTKTQEKILRQQIAAINAARRTRDPMAPIIDAELSVSRMKKRVLRYYGLQSRHIPDGSLTVLKRKIEKGI